MAGSEGDQLLAGAFHAIMDKTGWYTSHCKEVEFEMNLDIARMLFPERFQM